ncbi:hypothetical protein [Microbispora sp. NPDC049125]|uniref:hypothetical protein n=1 Tax=Microbispora sp. NPDC049125 TaxID=3154929 RepID=UPI003467417A
MSTTDASQRSEDRDRGGLNLNNRLLMQVPADQATDFWSVGDDDSGGIVVTGASALTAASTRTHKMTRPVLVDRRRYSGRGRLRGTARFDPSWIESQRALSTTTVLTDSGYVGEGDQEALVAILEQTTRAGDNVCAVLPLHITWLADPGLKLLVGEVNQYQVPVALVLEHASDPLSTQRAVTGLKNLLSQAQVPVSLLCTDISGLGAIAYGAAWAAVGVTSALRHLYPADKKGPPFRPSPARHAIVPRLMTFMNVERIAEGWARAQLHADLDENLWRCWCTECGNRTMDRFVTCTDLSLAIHNVSILDDLHQQITGPESWKRAISDALGWYLWMQDEYHLTWDSPAFMNAWLPKSWR